MSPPPPRGDQAWFNMDAKSFKIAMEEMGKDLKGCKGVTSWIMFGNLRVFLLSIKIYLLYA